MLPRLIVYNTARSHLHATVGTNLSSLLCVQIARDDCSKIDTTLARGAIPVSIDTSRALDPGRNDMYATVVDLYSEQAIAADHTQIIVTPQYVMCMARRLLSKEVQGVTVTEAAKFSGTWSPNGSARSTLENTMKKSKIVRSLMAVATTGLIAAMSPSAQAACGVQVDVNSLGGWITYGDANSYSLPVANYVATGNVKGPYSVQISDAKDCLYVAVDQNGGWIEPVGVEEPYATPTGENGTAYFATDPATYRGVNGAVNTQLDNAWDASLLAIRNYLTPAPGTTYDPVFLFQNNQQNSAAACGGATDSFCQSLAAWARVWITDENGDDLGYNFLFTNRESPFALFTDTPPGGGIPFGDPTLFSSTATAPYAPGTALKTDFVLSGGDICLASSVANPLLPFVGASCTGLSPALIFLGYDTLSPPIKHNLGNDEFPYVLSALELNALLSGLFGSLPDVVLENYTMHIDVRLGCGNPLDKKGDPIFASQGDPCLTSGTWGNGLNNGGESVIIAYGEPTDIPPPPVPEPASIALMGVALLAMTSLRRRIRVRQS